MIDRRWIARKIATRIVATNTLSNCKPLYVDRTLIEEYVKEFSNNDGILIDEKFERQLSIYGISIKSSK